MIRRILTDLDTLLDTRLATVSRMDEEAAKHMLSSRAYFERDYNDWLQLTGGRITNEQFDGCYAERGGENTAATINASVETGVSPVFFRLISEYELLQANNMTDETAGIGISINLWPYVLDAQSEKDLIDITRERYGENTAVETVNIPPEELTPQVLGACYAAYISYHFWDWLQRHYLCFPAQAIPQVNAVGPIWFQVANPDDHNLSPQEREKEFESMRLANTAYIDIQYVSMKFMSIFRM